MPISQDDLNWKVFCQVVQKESGHVLRLYPYMTGVRYWAECCRCTGAGNIVSGFKTVDEAMEMWRRSRLWRTQWLRRCRG